MMNLMKMSGLVATALCLFGCEPKSGVLVTKEANGYELHFKNCLRAKQILPVSGVRISKPTSQVPECELSWVDHQQPSINWLWTYGKGAPGYRVSDCKPLVPGETYLVHIEAGPAGGDASFQLEADGSVKMLDDGCK
jgi:hypothetical protein